METSVKYAVDLNIPRPHEINVDRKSPTIEQLKEYRSIWLLEAEQNGRAEDVFMIAKSLGQPVDVSEGKLYIGEYPLMLVKGDFKMVFWPGTKHLEIFVDGRCMASIHGPGSPTSKVDDYYLPGTWEAVLSGLGGKAEKKMIQGMALKAKMERAELIKLLLGGSI